MKRAMLVNPAMPWLIHTDLDAHGGYGTKMSPWNHTDPLAESQHHVIDPANLCCALDDGVEDRLYVRGRAADDAEHLGRRRLMFQGFTQFRIAFLEFLKQPHILDRDHGLISEGFEKSDLLIGKRLDFVCDECGSRR